jgi:hypothetical protein
MRHLRLLARSAVVSVVLAVPACGGDAETDLFGPGTGGTGALGGAAGSGIAGSGGTAGLAGATGIGAKGGQAGASGAGAKAGAGGSNAGAGGAGGKVGQGGAAGKAGQGGAAGKAGQGGAAGKAGQGGEAGASGGQAGAGQAGAAQGGEAGASGLGGATAGGASGGGGAIGGGAGEAGAAGQATGGGGQGVSGGGGLGGSGGSVSTCGNGVLDASEKCDGDLFGGVSCESLLGAGTVGKLACRPDCSFDATGCGLCGNGKIDPGEECEDGPDVASGRCDATCRIKCPDGGKAFAGHCYARFTDFKNWDAARKTCSDKQGHLVSIGSAEENAFVDTQLIGSSVIDVWIGYSDGGLEGSFVWVDGASTSYTNWDKNEPNDFFNAEDCATLNPSNGRWSDIGCGTFHHFVCEIDEPLKK